MNKPEQPPSEHVTNQSMQRGYSYQNGEEDSSPGQSCAERDAPVETAETTGEVSSRMASGSGEDEQVGERRRGEKNGRGGKHGQEDVEMNGGHDSVRGGTLRHSSSADGSPGSITGSGSTKR